MSLSLDDLKELVRLIAKEQTVSQPSEPSHIDHVCACPDCLCGVMDRLNKTSDYACADCGFPLGNKEFASKLPYCPNCHGESVKEVRRK